MTALVVLAICAAVLAVLLLPFQTRSRSRRRAPAADSPGDALLDEKDRVFQALADLRFDYEAGKMSRDDFENEEGRLRRQAAQLLEELEP
jgi:hypothetical protein